MFQNWEVLNTAVLTGRQVSQAMKIFIVSQAGKAADVTFQASCHSEDDSVLKVDGGRDFIKKGLQFSYFRYPRPAAQFMLMEVKFEVLSMVQFLSNMELTLVWHDLRFGCQSFLWTFKSLTLVFLN